MKLRSEPSLREEMSAQPCLPPDITFQEKIKPLNLRIVKFSIILTWIYKLLQFYILYFRRIKLMSTDFHNYQS